MKRICVILLLVLLLPGLLLGAGAALPEYYGESYYAELPAMVEKLKTTQGPKIVLVGGSNVAFGVDSALMEDLLSQAGESYTVCNFGLYAAVGTCRKNTRTPGTGWCWPSSRPPRPFPPISGPRPSGNAPKAARNCF